MSEYVPVPNLNDTPRLARLDADGVDQGVCRLTTLIELLDHDMNIEPALQLSNDGLIGLSLILQDVRSSVLQVADGLHVGGVHHDEMTPKRGVLKTKAARKRIRPRRRA